MSRNSIDAGDPPPQLTHLRLVDLTPRQREVAEAIGRGLNRRSIAEELSREGARLSIRTVDVHLRAIATRLPKDDLTASRRVRNWMRTQTGG